MSENKKITNLIMLMQQDIHEYELKYHGEFAENPHVGLGNKKTRCVNEATLRRTRQTLWSAVQMLTQKLCCQTIHDCPKVVPLHYESE